MSKPTYNCAACGGTFNRVDDDTWSDDEAAAEAKANGFAGEPCDIVCDDCYHKMMGTTPEDTDD